jgi:hypothetical protein
LPTPPFVLQSEMNICLDSFMSVANLARRYLHVWKGKLDSMANTACLAGRAMLASVVGRRKKCDKS